MKLRSPRWEAYCEQFYYFTKPKIKHKKCSTCPNNCSKYAVQCVKCWSKKNEISKSSKKT